MCFSWSVLDPARDADPGRVDEQVETAGALHVLAHDPLAVLGLRDVGGGRGRAELGPRRFDLLGRARRERELESLVAEHPRDRESDAR